MAGTNVANTANVTYGKPKVGGAIFSAPLGTALPTDAVSALDAKFRCLGYVSTDGLKNANTMESESVKAWGGDTVLVVPSESADTFTYTLIESLSVDVLKEVYGAEQVTGTFETGITVKATSAVRPVHVVVVDMAVKGGIKRIVVPLAQISEIGEVSYVDEDASGFEVTLTAVPDADGVTHYEYIKKA